MTQDPEPRDGETTHLQSAPEQDQASASAQPGPLAEPAAQDNSELAEREVVGVRLDTQQESFDYDTTGLILSPGDLVLVETERDPKPGTIVRAARKIMIKPAELRRVIRRTAKGKGQAEQQISPEQEKEAFQYGLTKIREFNLPMKLVRTEFNRSGSQISFYFSSEDRVDFRALVRDLARHFRARIEMCQIGVRDQAKKVGGVGLCGRELCCSSWIRRFAPVSIRMAKDQGLALNPQKVSGVCGRLLCCLNYEQLAYKELRKGLPKLGKRTDTPLGEGRVREVNVLRGKVKVQLPGGIKEFDRSELCKDCPKARDNSALAESEFSGAIDPVVQRPTGPRGPQSRRSPAASSERRLPQPRPAGRDKAAARPRPEDARGASSNRAQSDINSETRPGSEERSGASRSAQRRSSRGRSRSGRPTQTQGQRQQGAQANKPENRNKKASSSEPRAGANNQNPAKQSRPKQEQANAAPSTTASKKRRRRRRRKPRKPASAPAQQSSPQDPPPPGSSGRKD